MNVAGSLGLYGVVLAAVLAVSVVVGSAVDPVGLSNATPAGGHGGMSAEAEGGLPGLASTVDGYELRTASTVLPAGEPSAFEFRIVGSEGVVRRFDVEHTKRMHLVVVRRDLSGFQHLHPTMAPDGTWSTPLTLATAGVHRVYADFVVDGEKHTLGADVSVAGAFDPEPLPAASRTADAGDGYTVTLDGAPVAGEESELAFTVRRDGEVVDELPTYLGARGHLVALRGRDLAYLHVHADEDRLAFEADFPSAGSYRLFLQFRHGGEVRTAAFTVDAGEQGR